jgi:putative ABC transport system permease protein
MPSGFEFQDKDTELWTMITPTDEYFSVYQGMHILQTIARLLPGVTPQEAQAEMNVLQRQVDAKHPDGVVDSSITVTRLRDDLSEAARPALLVLVAVVAFVLLIACANVANLLLGRASERRKEIAVRTALGAGRGRLFRQMLTESVLIFALGGALGTALAWFALGLVVSSNPFRLPRVDQIAIDPVVLGFAALLSLATGLVFGLIPALQAPRVNVSNLLKDESRGASSSIRSHRARNALVVVEIALSMILLVGAALLMATFRRLAFVPVGIDPDGVLTMRIEMGKANYPDAPRRDQFLDQILLKVGSLPGIKSAAFTSNLPLTGVLTDKISIQGRPAPAPSDVVLVGKETVTPDFFRVFGVRLVKGRELGTSDQETTRLVTVINEAMADRIFPNEDPIGKRIKHGDLNDPYPWMEVVGIVSDVRQLTPEAGDTPVMFIPYPQVTADYVGILARNMSLVVKSATGSDSAYSSIRRAIWALDPDMPISNVMSMSTLISESIQEPRVRAALVAIFAGFALIIAAVGLYGVISQSVAQRRYELGIRVALGAAQRRIRLMVLMQGMTLALIGIVIGAGGALFLTRLLRGLLFGVKPNDPAIFVLVSAILLVVAAVATYFPAHRATRSDPLVALRSG